LHLLTCEALSTCRWYSFDYAQVHFIAVDTEVGYPHSPEGPGTPMNGGPFGDQLAWLEADLKKAVANRAQVPWILVAGHRPYYSSTGESGVWDPSRPAFEPLFLKYNVDIVYWGHVHWYERSVSSITHSLSLGPLLLHCHRSSPSCCDTVRCSA
jgi:hypothetical protein